MAVWAPDSIILWFEKIQVANFEVTFIIKYLTTCLRNKCGEWIEPAQVMNYNSLAG